MFTQILVRYAHFASIFVLVAVVFGQWFLVQKSMKRREIVGLQRLDILYAISAVAVLATGFLQWFVVGKGADFYSENALFHTKTMLFLVVGLLSIYPSVFFGRQRKGEVEEVVSIPPLVIWSVRLELIFLFAMPLLATLMARGIGLVST